jgi:ABC-2 type transport system ATP-binding protein
MIEVHDLHKRYGETAAVNGLSFAVEPGRVTGFVGPNGAGKSTTLRLILGLDAPDGGQALVGGRRYASLRRPLCHVGSLLDATDPHPARRARDHLRWLAAGNGLPSARVDEVLEETGLSGAAGRRVRGYSLGMRQRLGLAAALLGDPQVLLLDEPVNGLDPEGIRWIRGFLRELAAEGRTVLVSSHLMSELEGTADHLLVIRRGRLVADAPVAELLAGERVAVRTPEPLRLMPLLTAAGATVESPGGGRLSVTDLPAGRIAGIAASNGVPLHELTPGRRSLEDVYMELTR